MASALSVDLNCDLGESFGCYRLGQDADMMSLVTSINIACGLHAGDSDVMAETVAQGVMEGVALGAHPGYPDLQGFGRRQMVLTPQEIENLISYQLGALSAFAKRHDQRLSHLKPHGALYNFAAKDQPAAMAIARAVLAFDPDLILVGLAGSLMVEVGQALGLRVANEGFPDRAYQADGSLMPRSVPGAVLTDPLDVADNALRLVKEGIIIKGQTINIDTLCLHGDNPQAVQNAKAVRQALEVAGVRIVPL
jgi:5-oxoprolinase (ATP-hydrolysing) subunit A